MSEDVAPGYRAILRTPGALRVFLPALVGRLSLAMITLSLLLATVDATGSFAVAGLAAGAFGVSNVVASPYRARAVDRFGQRLALTTMATLYSGALVGLSAATAVRAADAALVMLAVVAGAFAPPLGAAMRVQWSRIARTDSARRRAYSLDAVSEEILFTTGPLIAALVCAAAPAAGLLVSAGVALVGTIGMTSAAASTHHTGSTRVVHRRFRPLAQPQFRSVLIALVGAGVVLGVVDVAAPAAAGGETIIAGVLLACFSVGSGVGGLLYGHREFASGLGARLLVLCAALAVFSAALAITPGLVWLGIGLAVVGFFLAPTLVTGYLLADELTVAEVRTEASSWINTGVNTGAALAAALAGVLVDAGAGRVVFALGAAAALLCVAVGVPGLRHAGTTAAVRAAPPDAAP